MEQITFVYQGIPIKESLKDKVYHNNPHTEDKLQEKSIQYHQFHEKNFKKFSVIFLTRYQVCLRAEDDFQHLL
jgi:hypothetical protein